MPKAARRPPPIAAVPEPLLTSEAAAAVLGVAAQTLAAWRCRGHGPRYLKIGRAVRYRLPDLLAHMRHVDPAAQKAA